MDVADVGVGIGDRTGGRVRVFAISLADLSAHSVSDSDAAADVSVGAVLLTTGGGGV